MRTSWWRRRAVRTRPRVVPQPGGDPEVKVQVPGDRFTATARDATPEEKPDMWSVMTKAWPQYDEYQAKTDREIPVVMLERA